MTSLFAVRVAPASSPRWSRRGSICSSSDGRETLVMCRERRGSGRPALARSALGAYSSGPRVGRTCLSTWDEGIPDDIPHEHLYGISFNAGNFVKALRKIEGAANGSDRGYRQPERLVGQPVTQGVSGGRARRRGADAPSGPSGQGARGSGGDPLLGAHCRTCPA